MSSINPVLSNLACPWNTKIYTSLLVWNKLHATHYQSKRTKGGCDVNTDNSNEACDFEMNDRICLAITDGHWGRIAFSGLLCFSRESEQVFQQCSVSSQWINFVRYMHIIPILSLLVILYWTCLSFLTLNRCNSWSVYSLI